MADKSGKREGTRHVGADVDADLAEKFSVQCEQRGFFQRQVIALLIEDWIKMPEFNQIEFYHRRDSHDKEFREQVEAVLRQLKVLPQEGGDDASAKKR